MHHKPQPPSPAPGILPSLNGPVDQLVQRFPEPSAIRAYLRTFPGSRIVDDLEEVLRGFPIKQIHGKLRTTEEWLSVSKRIYAEIVHSWTPRMLSLQELHRYRWDSKRRLAVIYLLEEVVKRLQPLLHVPLTEMIMIARLDYSARFGRLFRINELPVEILSSIFHYVVWSANDPDECNRSRLALSGTCRHWRRLVVGDPTLWNTFCYRVDTPGQLAFSKLTVERCGTAPIDIRLRDTQEYPLSQEDMEDILDHLTTRRSQLRILSVAVQEWEAGLTLLRWLQAFGTQKLPCILKRLEIHRLGPPYVQLGPDQPPNSSPFGPLPLLGGAYAASLRYFAISGLHIDWTQTTLKHLTTLDIRRVPLDSAPDMDRFRDILIECPELDRLVLHGAGPKWRPPAECHPPVTLHKLRSLILADFALNYAQFVLSILVAPDVKELALYGFTGEDYTMLFEQLTGLFPKVRLLTMVSIELASEEHGTQALVRLFASMPEVKFLQISKISESFWDVFHFNPKTLVEYPNLVDNIITDPTHILFPDLNCLDVNYSPWSSLCKFLTLRRHVGYGVDRVYVAQPYWMELNVGERNTLRQLTSTLLPHSHPSKILDEEQSLE
ncbi:hypothetical protein P691DRAFT_657078 [Macrolepiota fuliginosa MF-IS2]|uniref:F-box domain-containing protein n=1 Tax=Macrolepiota fuliginosa MF-IS2 TaxID=1400762 RepID=A0A9P5XP39_9AGAR|nr:hypothetical protein P691DRAFT_657078 [Macrolepiota fuliginosa MF-IS2]